MSAGQLFNSTKSRDATPQDASNGEPDGYQYTPLDKTPTHIRLVTLRPGCWTDDIVCTIEIARFDTDPSYEALWYV